MKILYMGNKNRGLVCLKALLKEGENICGVVIPDRKVKLSYESLKQFAIKRKISIFHPSKINAPIFVQKIKKMVPDLIIMAGYNQILKKEIIRIPKKGVINLHGGKLPQYRGSSTLNWMIINGETKGGVAIILIDAGIDTGDIIAKESFEIRPNDTIKEVIYKTDKIFPRLLIKVIRQIKNGTVKRKPQPPGKGTYYHTRYPRDGKINWERSSAKEVYNLVRALTHPCPGAFTYFNNKKLIIWKASLIEEDIRGIPGRVCLRRRRGIVAIAADRGLLITRVQPEGKSECDANDFFNHLSVDLT
ncbi:methionyl-tRNA formyltransferase [bacterium]|nr:methionyl-tRNA formyltransferase [bacterium]